jgi:hypothetical protein
MKQKRTGKPDKGLFSPLDFLSLILILISSCLVFFLFKNFSPTFYHLAQCFNVFLVPPIKTSSDVSIFNFSVFVTALALLVAIFSATDPLYKFRVSVAPIPILKIAVPITFFLGFGILLSDIWFAKGFSTLFFLSDQVYIQAFFAIVFFILVVMWVYFSYFKNSLFSRANAERYFRKLHNLIFKGSESDLQLIAHEVLYSIPNLIKYSPEKYEGMNKKKFSAVEEYAFHTLNLLGDKRLCKHIISSSPVTAMVLFDEASLHKKYNLPINDFAVNISTEAIANKDSILYQEDDYISGLIGHLKSFTYSIYSNYKFIEALAKNNGSPFNIRKKLDVEQLEVYCEVFLVFCGDYFEYAKEWKKIPNSRAFKEGLKTISMAASDLYKVADITSSLYETDIYRRFSCAGNFIHKLSSLMDEKLSDVPFKLRKSKNLRDKDIVDYICDFISDLIRTSKVIKEPDKAWRTQYSAIWSEIFSYEKDEVSLIKKALFFRLRRKLYNEIVCGPNYVSLGILGYCLNTMGFKIAKKESSGSKHYEALHRALLSWTKKNFLEIYKEYPKMTEDCLIGAISFDKDKKRLVRTYGSIFGLEPEKEYLQL